MEKKQLILKIIEPVLLLPTLIWIYTPIIAGILIAMVHYVPLAFTTWWLFSFLGHPNWVLGVLIIRSEIVFILLIIIEFILFILGMILFLWGLVYLAKVKHKKQGLAIGGPYKWVRHPQHFGLILMTFVISLYIPWSIDSYIRIGEILSWSLFSLFLIVISELEERKLLKQYGEEYLNYKSSTGSFFPRIFVKHRKKRGISKVKHWKRFLLISFIYVCFISLIRLLVFILRLPEKPRIGWWYDYLSPRFWYINLIFLGIILLTLGIKTFRESRFPIELKKEE